jgi:predicted phage-related endonuclease
MARATDGEVGKALDWGNEYEPICKAYYSELRGVTIEEMPFVEINDYSGASPDGMVDGELIEIKCPYNTANHLKTAFEGYIDPKYLWQMQGQMLATGATACRFISFDPRIQDERFILIEIRVEADLEMQEQLRERLAFANDKPMVRHSEAKAVKSGLYTFVRVVNDDNFVDIQTLNS